MTDIITTRRDFIKNSIVAGTTIAISGTVSTGIASTTDARAFIQRVDQPLNQVNMFDYPDCIETAWAGQFGKTGELRL